MNAFTSFPVVLDGAAWAAAHASVNGWRGRAIQHFAEAEAEVSETLLTLATDPKRGAKVGRQLLVGQRFEDLSVAVCAEGDFPCPKTHAKLRAFREHEALRKALCHGAGTVSLSARGEWVLVLRMITLRGSGEERSTIVYEQRQAEALVKELRAEQQRLCAALRSLRERFGEGSL